MVDDDFKDLDESSNNGDVEDQFKKGEVNVRGKRSEIAESSGPSDELVDAPIEDAADSDDKGDGNPKAVGGFEFVRAGQVGAHAEEVEKKDVLDKDRLDEKAKELHQGLFLRVLVIQMNPPKMKKAAGARGMRPKGTKEEGMTGRLKRVPNPKSSRMAATAIRIAP